MKERVELEALPGWASGFSGFSCRGMGGRGRDRLGLRLRTGLEEVQLHGLAGLVQGLEGIGQEGVLLLIPLAGGHEAIDKFRVRGQPVGDFVHESEHAGVLPAGLEEELGVRIVSGFADDAESHFHDGIEFAQQALMQVGVIAPGHKGHFLAQVDLVVLECRDREAVPAG